MILCLFLLSSCGKRQIDIEPEFQEIYSLFLSEASNHGRMLYNTNNITIRRGDTSTCPNGINPDACCNKDFGITSGSVEIIVSDKYQFKGPDKKHLIFHELGHCLLYKEHNLSLNSDKQPQSIMHPFLLTYSTEYFEDHWPSYLEELFSYAD